MTKKKVLLIGGSLNQTMMMHAIGTHLAHHDCFYTAFFTDGILYWPRKLGLLDRSIAGFGSFRRDTMNYLQAHALPIDDEGKSQRYDLVVTCTDLIVPKRIRQQPLVLVQEGMTDPENLLFRICRSLRLPYWLAVNTAATGLSDLYTIFCVASEAYKEHFAARGIKKDKLRVTGIPNYDNAAAYKNNQFPHRDFVLVATSDTREALKYEDRQATIANAVRIAAGRKLIFKLHPNENVARATEEIAKWAPGALVFSSGNVHEMIANCSVLITRFSTVVYTGLALGKEVYSEFDLSELNRLVPWQNGGTSGARIAAICEELL